MDIAEGHLAALNFLNGSNGAHIHNLGTGKGTTVLELIKEFEKSNGLMIPHKFALRRDGDLPSYYSDATKALNELKWFAKRNLSQACRDVYRFSQTQLEHK